MKILFAFFAFFTLSQSAFSMTNQQITRLILNDPGFIESVEMNIKNTFRRPESVRMQFVSVGAQMNRAPYFQARFDYQLEAERVQFGVCTYIMQGILKSSNSVAFDKIVHEDCGE